MDEMEADSRYPHFRWNTTRRMFRQLKIHHHRHRRNGTRDYRSHFRPYYLDQQSQILLLLVLSNASYRLHPMPRCIPTVVRLYLPHSRLRTLILREWLNWKMRSWLLVLKFALAEFALNP
jgi:hypothetical protein